MATDKQMVKNNLIVPDLVLKEQQWHMQGNYATKITMSAWLAYFLLQICLKSDTLTVVTCPKIIVVTVFLALWRHSFQQNSSHLFFLFTRYHILLMNTHIGYNVWPNTYLTELSADSSWYPVSILTWFNEVFFKSIVCCSTCLPAVVWTVSV